MTASVSGRAQKQTFGAELLRQMTNTQPFERCLSLFMLHPSHVAAMSGKSGL